MVIGNTTRRPQANKDPPVSCREDGLIVLGGVPVAPENNHRIPDALLPRQRNSGVDPGTTRFLMLSTRC